MKNLSTFLVAMVMAFTGFAQSEKDSLSFKIGKVKYSVISNDSITGVKFDSDTEDDKWLNGHLEFGVNGYLSNNGALQLNKGDELMEINYGRSRYFAYYFTLDGVNLVKDKVLFTTGLGLSYNGYFFENNIQIGTDNDTTLFSLDTTNTYQKYKLRATYLQLPAMLKFKFHPKKDKGLSLSVGVIGSYRVGSLVKAKYRENGDEQKDKIKDDFNLSPFKADLTMRLGYNKVGLVFNYGVTSLFEPGKAPELYPFSIGLTIGGGF